MKLLLLVFSLFISFASFPQEFEVDTVAKPYLANYSKIMHHTPKGLTNLNSPERWKNYSVNSIMGLLYLFDNIDKFSESDRAWAEAAAVNLATAFFDEGSYTVLGPSGYSAGPPDSLRNRICCGKNVIGVILCMGCKCITAEMAGFIDIFNKKMMELVCSKQ